MTKDVKPKDVKTKDVKPKDVKKYYNKNLSTTYFFTPTKNPSAWHFSYTSSPSAWHFSYTLAFLYGISVTLLRTRAVELMIELKALK